MAGRGPAPKTQHQRERDTKRRQADAVHLRADGVLRGPDFPHWIVNPHPAAVQWWENIRSSPQAQLFEDTDWDILAGAARGWDEYWKGAKVSATLLSELRLIGERYGATFVDRQRAKIHIERGEAADAEVVQLRSVSSRADVMARMKGEK
ncbi:minor tail protein [Arthrobacter phage Lizalica]|uniref:Terminase small subunit n=1 Tax=Arthrobacter phage Lizalica TaxID=2832319 RepID=A0AA49B4G4_9CAUD|nr:minor tail protein [Arthrobacter phage Lizalica]UIW13485.1 terminase small subunit [Arthrobacter phage Lizalica]